LGLRSKRGEDEQGCAWVALEGVRSLVMFGIYFIRYIEEMASWSPTFGGSVNHSYA
jgi:hypothetical protein